MDKSILLLQIVKLETELQLIAEEVKTMKLDLISNNIPEDKGKNRFQVIKEQLKQL
jgi:hypothetical protein